MKKTKLNREIDIEEAMKQRVDCLLNGLDAIPSDDVESLKRLRDRADNLLKQVDGWRDQVANFWIRVNVLVKQYEKDT